MKPAELVFDSAIKALKKAKKTVNNATFETIVYLMTVDPVWTVGVGKASLVSKKLASTLASQGRRAYNLDATNALHGDIGAVQYCDILIVFSNSGMTDELEIIIKRAGQNGATIVLVTGNASSKLGKLVDFVIDYGKVKEACRLGLTPTTSYIVMSVIADALAMSVQERTKVTFADYALNHHAGYLGKKARSKKRILRKSAKGNT